MGKRRFFDCYTIEVEATEMVSDHRGDRFRTVYNVRFGSAVYVLHAFQKKSKRGAATPHFEMSLVERRLREAEQPARGDEK